MASKRRTLLGNELPAFNGDSDAGEVDDEAEKRQRRTSIYDASDVPNRMQQRKEHAARVLSEKNNEAGAQPLPRPSVPPIQQNKPSNEQLSALYNSCVKMLNENKINAKNAFQLKLIDYMSDIVLNKNIVGGITNFQVVGCTIDAGTKIYAARVDALHQNTYQMLSGLGHGAEQEQQNEDGGQVNEVGGLEEVDDEEDEAGNKKGKGQKQRRRMKKSTQIQENLELITQKPKDEFMDDDLYFQRISTCIENEAISGILTNKLHFMDDSGQMYINVEDVHTATAEASRDTAAFRGVDLNLKELCDSYKSINMKNMHLCNDLKSFKFIGWNMDESDDISKLVETMHAAEDEEDRELNRLHGFDANNLLVADLNMSSRVISSQQSADVHADIDNMSYAGDTDIDGGGDGGDLQPHPEGYIDDIRSLHSIAELTTLISHSPSDYSYFNLEKLNLHHLPKHLKSMAANLVANVSPAEGAAALVARNAAKPKREAPRLDLSVLCDRQKLFKVTKKAIYLCDRTIEKRSMNPCRLEVERQVNYNSRELFQPYWKAISAKLFTDFNAIENLLLNNEEAQLDAPRAVPLDDYDDDGAPNDDYEIAGTAATAEPFFSQHGGEFVQTQGDGPMDDMGEHPMPEMQQFDGDYLVQAPLQVNPLNIEYAKTSKNIDVRRLKQVIWSLLSNEHDKQENISELNNSDGNMSKRTNQSVNVNASLKAIYSQLKPPLVTQKVYEDLSICIVFQMILFLANEYSLVLTNTPTGSDVTIRSDV